MIKKLLFLLPLILILTAAGCRGNVSNIGKVAVATQVNIDNSPIGDSQSVILATTPAIYLSAEVINGQIGTKVDVEWRYITGNKILATEFFRGNRNNSRPHEFVTGKKLTDSFLSSRIVLSKLGWDLGSYEVVIQLDGQIVKRIGFNIVSSNEFDDMSKKAMLKKLYLGSKINNQAQIAIPGSRFTQNQEKIYAVALLQNVPAGTIIQAVWKHLDNNQVITSFSVPFSNSGYLPFEISLDRFGRLWSDNLWPKGTYEVSIYVDNVLVTTSNFTVF